MHELVGTERTTLLWFKPFFTLGLRDDRQLTGITMRAATASVQKLWKRNVDSSHCLSTLAVQRLWQTNTFSVDSDDVVVWERVVDTFDQLANAPRMVCDFGNGPTRRDVVIKVLAVSTARKTD